MASARKKQDEKNVKTLRELAALPENRYCFDCNQRGPTYVNISIGSFVCTKCSGLLRGLTPPQRVKSISMATFTAEEVDTMRQRGNCHCRQTWMALYDGIIPTDGIGDEQKVRDFMVDKYERKRYFAEAATLRNGHDSEPAPRVKPPKVEPEVRPLRLNGVGRPEHRHPTRPPPNGRHDFVADFAHADIFNAVNNNSGSFANFDNNPVFNNASSVPTQPLAIQVSNGAKGGPPVAPPPPEDKYAALKDLDNALKAQPAIDWSSGSSGSSIYSTPPSGGSTYNSPMSQGSSVYGSPTQGQFPSPFGPSQSPPTSNPFNAFWAGDANHAPNTVINGCAPSANPFRGPEPGLKGNGLHPHFQGLDFGQPLNGAPQWTPNPFKIGAASNGFSNNPFL